MNFKWIFLGALGLAAGYGIGYLVRQGQMVAATKIEYAGYRINSLSKNSASITIDLKITNASDTAITKRSQSYAVYLTGQKVATVNDATLQTLPSKTPVPVSITVNFNPAEVLKDSWQQLITTGIKNMNVRIDGRIWANTKFFPPIAIPVNSTWTLNDFKK